MPENSSILPGGAAQEGGAVASAFSPGAIVGRYRWVICTLLLFGVTKNYMDRTVLGVLADTLQHHFSWTQVDYSNIVAAFQLAYGLGMVVMGRVIDRLGTRVGYAVAMVFWSLASMAHALCNTLLGFIIARAALGLGESGVFPASIKSVAEWFPRKERALATGIFNAGTNVGAIVTPFMVPWITIHWGWRAAFIVTGAIGLIWVAFWWVLYRRPEEHPKLGAAELAYIQSDREAPSRRFAWATLLRYRQTWAFMAAKFLTDPIWWFYLFWVPDFLQRQHGVRLTHLGAPIMVIYLLSDAGSVAGGWLSSWRIRRGATVNAGRKTAMLVCAIAVLPIVFASHAQGLWTAVLLIGLAAAAHQGFSANLFTLASDMFPNPAVASVVGIGGFAGAMGGVLIAKVVGYALQWTGSYLIPFLIASMAYLLALAIVHRIVPNLEPAPLAAE